MEIISYVHDSPRKKSVRPSWLNTSFSIPLPSFEKKERKTKSVTFSSYSQELKSFGVQKVKKPVSVKTGLTVLGHALTVTGDFIVENVKKVLITIACFVTFAAVSVGVFNISYKFVNFTGPLALQDGDSIEVLNKLMASFALEGIADYDDSGKLLDAANVKQKFTQPVSYQTYKVQAGDTISGIAKKFGLTNISTLISVNDIGNVRALASGQKLKIPSIDGIIYTVKSGDSLDAIVRANKISLEELLDVNELTSETLVKGQQLFLPGASLDSKTLKTAMGDKFIIPIQAKFRWTSPYGKRIDPIANVASFHTGTDMACPTGTPIVAAMSGTVKSTGVSRVYGNYVIIDHGNGYQTLYAHMSKIIASKGQWVSQGTRIGLVGSTGYSTGPHLHFTVYKNGKMVDPMSVLK